MDPPGCRAATPRQVKMPAARRHPYTGASQARVADIPRFPRLLVHMSSHRRWRPSGFCPYAFPTLTMGLRHSCSMAHAALMSRSTATPCLAAQGRVGGGVGSGQGRLTSTWTHRVRGNSESKMATITDAILSVVVCRGLERTSLHSWRMPGFGDLCAGPLRRRLVVLRYLGISTP